jgi:hypothetical protein
MSIGWPSAPRWSGSSSQPLPSPGHHLTGSRNCAVNSTRAAVRDGPPYRQRFMASIRVQILEVFPLHEPAFPVDSRPDMKPLSHLVAALLLLPIFTAVPQAGEWPVPVAGNAFRVAPAPGSSGFQRNGTLAWGDAEGVFSVYFHVDRPAVLDLALRARVPEGGSAVVTRVLGRTFETLIEGAELGLHSIGRVEVPRGGYVRVDLQGAERSGRVYAEIRELVVASDTEDLVLDYVKTNQGNMFYWGRRGPSVHLRYEVPRDRQFRFAYSEITVPEGQDTIGSFFMANGFGEGYFGIQVNGPEERRVLFSVWSPFQTDNPRDIPEDQRIIALGHGPGVRVGEFGNEGSGGQSFLVHPWQAGTTYRFLTEVKPDGQGNTSYTAWFGDKSAGEWRLIASFRRPKTDTHLRGFHSFLENFIPTTGHLERRALHGNVWVGDLESQWHECTRARFSVDATGNGRHRLDFTGGAEGESFFLRNCGFFNETGKPGDVFTRQSTADQKPDIDFDALPRG